MKNKGLTIASKFGHVRHNQGARQSSREFRDDFRLLSELLSTLGTLETKLSSEEEAIS